MIGNSVVLKGTDRATGEQYPPAGVSQGDYITRERLLPNPSVIRVYQGDWVQFMGVGWNVDPFPIPGITTLQMHYKALTDTIGPLDVINFLEYYNRNIVFDETVPTFGTGVPVIPDVSNFVLQPPAVQIAGPGSDMPGNQYCQFMSTNPTFYLGFLPVFPYFDWKIPSIFSLDFGGGFHYDFGRTMSCAEIAYNYDLTPSISVNPSSNDVTLGVTNKKQGGITQTYTMPTQWQVTQFNVQNVNDPKVQSLMTGSSTTSQSDPCTFLVNSLGPTNMSGCTVPAPNAQSSGYNTIFDKDGTISSTIDPNNKGTPFPTSLPDPPAGKTTCYMLSVNKYQPYVPNPYWKNSTIVCRFGAPKKPKIQVLGDDLHAGGQIITSQVGGDTATTFGSWAAYASASGDQATNFATGSGLKGGKPSTTLTQLDVNSLTFANTQATFGSFASASTVLGNAGKIQSYFSALKKPSPSLTAGSNQNLDNIPDSVTPYFVDGKLTIQSSTIPKGKTIIIVANDTITIAGDIHYATDNLNTLAEIPQLVLVAPRIIINSSVQNVDAWLITDLHTAGDGTPDDRTTYYVDTCGDAGPPSSVTLTTSTACNDNPLTVNGPVVTSHLYLNRTAGDDTSDSAAETFNNRGDAYLWELNYASNNEGLATTKQTEQPTRF